MAEKKSVFAELNAVNVNEHKETKNGLSYLAWAWAWAEVKKRYPDATYTVYERDGQHGPCNYFTDGKTAWVKTGVTIGGLEHIEYLPVMDFRNQSIPLERVTSMDVNKTIQRSLTKACARHGLGLYIYAGEDLPEEGDGEEAAAPSKPKASPSKPKAQPAASEDKARKAGLMVWNAYKSLDANKGKANAELVKGFNSLVERVTGKKSHDLTVAEWQNVAENLNAAA